jgi:very-short-patch-repair endonuclease
MRDSEKRQDARRLRRQMTDHERKLWRECVIGGCSARNSDVSIPIGPYIADFACDEHKLVVELDGGQHADEIRGHRDETLKRAGWTILRFWNNELTQNREGVLVAISQHIEGKGQLRLALTAER